MLPQFNGQSSYISFNSFNIGDTITFSFWLNGSTYDGTIPFSENTSTYKYGPDIYFAYGSISWNIGDGDANHFTNSIYPNANWHNIVVTNSKSANIANLYIDGNFIGSAAYRDSTMNGRALYLGAPSWLEYFFKGNMANAQIYNASLSASQVQYLYQEGIGGAPVQLQNLVGWWPLNGDANDYSGNGNNGAAVNILYVGT